MIARTLIDKTQHTYKHFKLPNHNFNQHTRFTLIEQLDSVNIDKHLATLQLKKREDFCHSSYKSLSSFVSTE